MGHRKKLICWFDEYYASIILCRELWEKYGFEPVNIIHFEDSEEGFLFILKNRVDLVISHMLAPYPDKKYLRYEGHMLCESVKTVFPDIPFIIYSAISDGMELFKTVKPDY